jgi:beta-1,4-N-acetylglucosaminyltransferase
MPVKTRKSNSSNDNKSIQHPNIVTNTNTINNNINRIVFVTVGTTHFDLLTQTVDTPTFADALIDAGYTHLIIQAGAGNYQPHKLFGNHYNKDTYYYHSSSERRDSSKGNCDRSNTGSRELQLSVEWFEYTPSLASYLEKAALVISHAGAGSLFETLRMRKPLIAVPNPALMDDHQKELAEKLEDMGHLVSATVEELIEVVGRMDVEVLVPYEAGNAKGIVEKINQLL